MTPETAAPPPPLEVESDELFDLSSRVTRAMIGGIVLTKIGILAVVFAIDPSKMTALITLISSWLWILAALVLLSGPLAYRWRLHRVRARRVALQQAEWMVEPDGPHSNSK